MEDERDNGVQNIFALKWSHMVEISPSCDPTLTHRPVLFSLSNVPCVVAYLTLNQLI